MNAHDRRRLVLLFGGWVLLIALALSPRSGWCAEDATAKKLLETRCSVCHLPGAGGQLDGIQSVRKTPEGWRMTIDRMVRLNRVNLTGPEEETLVKFLSDEYGLAPDEVKDYRWALERRMNVFDNVADATSKAACAACHSFARIALQRRTPEMWQRLPDSLLALFPFIELQVRGLGDDWYHVAKEGVVPYLTKTFPFDSEAWRSWKAAPKKNLAGKWAAVGYDPASGDYTGVMTVTASGADEYQGEFSVELADGKTLGGKTAATVYTGFQWRGDTTLKDGKKLRDIFFVSPNGEEMEGRSLQSAYGDLGADEKLYRIGQSARVLSVTPRSLKADGKAQKVKVFGMNLPAGVDAAKVNLGDGIEVRKILRSDAEQLVADVVVAKDAKPAARAVKVGDVGGEGLLSVYRQIDYIKILPDRAYVYDSGIRMPKAHQQFDAVAFTNGADGVKETADDVRIGRVNPVKWKLTEYFRTAKDDDVRFVGSINGSGLFTPADDAPNPNRDRTESNEGDVWVSASHEEEGTSYEARAFLLVMPARFVFPAIR